MRSESILLKMHFTLSFVEINYQIKEIFTKQQDKTWQLIFLRLLFKSIMQQNTES